MSNPFAALAGDDGDDSADEVEVVSSYFCPAFLRLAAAHCLPAALRSCAAGRADCGHPCVHVCACCGDLIVYARARRVASSARRPPAARTSCPCSKAGQHCGSAARAPPALRRLRAVPPQCCPSEKFSSLALAPRLSAPAPAHPCRAACAAATQRQQPPKTEKTKKDNQNAGRGGRAPARNGKREFDRRSQNGARGCAPPPPAIERNAPRHCILVACRRAGWASEAGQWQSRRGIVATAVASRLPIELSLRERSPSPS